MPKLAVPPEGLIDLAGLFAPGTDKFALEVGFGGGEHLVARASANPDWGFIGCEPFLNGIAQLLTKIEEAEHTNIRIHTGDARDILDRLPERALSAVYVLFPDPWPKRRHWKRRLISNDTLQSLARVMKPGTQLIFASDDVSYVRWALALVMQSGLFDWLAERPADWRMRPQGAPETRYEAKARLGGRPCAYLVFERRQSSQQ